MVDIELRDYFAGQIMQALVAQSFAAMANGVETGSDDLPLELSKWAYIMADDLIKASIPEPE